MITFYAILSSCAWLAYWRHRRGWVISLFVIAGIFYLLTGGMDTPLWELVFYVVLITVTSYAFWSKTSPRHLAVAYGVNLMLLVAIEVVLYIPSYQEHQRLLVKYPLQDIAPRLAYEKTDSFAEALALDTISPPSDRNSPAAQILRDRFNVEISHSHTWLRPRALAAMSKIHSNFVMDFIDQPSFGKRRMGSVVLRERFVVIPEPALIPQPTSPVTDDSPGHLHDADRSVEPPLPSAGGRARDNPANSLPDFNAVQVVDFAPWASLGRQAEGGKFRGFLSHAFRHSPEELKLPESDAVWRVAKLELVSLLKHQPPAAYVSENLPAMDELKQAPTRALDEFETQSITRLRQGEEIVVEATHNEQRMVGAIRALRECTDCHKNREGGLLGAFTYRFYRSPRLPEPVPEKSTKPVTLRGVPSRFVKL